MKKFFLSFFLIFFFIFYSIYQRIEKSGVRVFPQNASKTHPTNTISPSSAESFDDTTQKVSALHTRYKDGEYSGDVADALYGNLQVKVHITAGRMSDVELLQYPNDRPTSVAINTQAISFWKQEAIQKQNSDVDIVSGATDSSQAFRVSLASALKKAEN